VLASLVGLGLRIYQSTRPGYLSGVTEYDDGTDFGSAVRLIHGAVPYRDFIMVQPPGITLLMVPIAVATKAAGTAVGMVVARIVTLVAGAGAVLLAGLLVRHRGLFAVIATCGTLAIYPDSLLAARTVLLEPWLVLFCLLGALAVFDGDQLAGRRRLFLGGLALGFAGAIKVWAILPVLVVLVQIARRRRRPGGGSRGRDTLSYVAGVVIGFGVPVLPFALSAPSIFYRSVIIAQLVRSDVTRVAQGYRLQQMLGLTHTNQLTTPTLVTIGVIVVVAIAAVSVLASRLAAAAPPPLEVFALVTTVLVVVSFLWPADFYYHYAAFLTPFVALAIALPVSRLLAALHAGPTWGAGAAGSARLQNDVLDVPVPHDATLHDAVLHDGTLHDAARLEASAQAAPSHAVTSPAGLAQSGEARGPGEPGPRTEPGQSAEWPAGPRPASGRRAGTPRAGTPRAGARRMGPVRRNADLVQATVTIVAAVVMLVLIGLQIGGEAQEASQVPASEITQAAHLIPPGACVATDQVSYTIAINRFVSSQPGCSQMVDGVGTDYALSGHNGLSKEGATPAVEAEWMAAFRSAQYLWLTSQADKRIPWTTALLTYLRTRFKPLTDGPDFVYVRIR
jgi:hypothetical protein